MIIVKLQGGLGNQLFQYAAAKSLSLRYNCPLFIDDTFLKSNDQTTQDFTARYLQLNLFNTTCKVIAVDRLYRLTDPRMLKKMINKMLHQQLRRYQEPFLGYDPNFENIRPPVYLDGYWQSPNYFKSIAGTIRADFMLKPVTLTTDQQEVAEQIDAANAVAVHVRRTDYVTSLANRQKYAELDHVYYEKAISRITDRVKEAKFFVFSDDPAWVEQLPVFQKIGCQVVLHQQPCLNADAVDFFLMSKCKHYIIANSTFSWWAAWLNNTPRKIVIAPDVWFKTNPEGFAVDNLIPPDWTRL